MGTLYVLSLIPPTAVGEQYYMFIYPFFVISIIYAINQISIKEKLKTSLKITLSVLVIAGGITSYSKSYYLKSFIIEKKEFNTLINTCDLIVIRCFSVDDFGRLVTQILPQNSKVLFITNESLDNYIHQNNFKRIAVFNFCKDQPKAPEQIPNYKYLEYQFNSEFNSNYNKRVIHIYSILK